MTVAPLQDGPSHLAARYLFPTERFRGEWRRHAIYLSTPLTVGVVATVVLGGLAGYMAGADRVTFDYAGWVMPLSIVAWVLIMAYVGWRVAYWHFYRFILTNKRIMLIQGIIARDVAMMPLLRVTDMKYEQTPMGRLLNYGTFVIESAGQDQALREIDYLPQPNDIYLWVVEEMYEPEAVAARLHETEDAEEEV
jgi:membrane protein YdbS with pleckstrin-like domain